MSNYTHMYIIRVAQRLARGQTFDMHLVTSESLYLYGWARRCGSSRLGRISMSKFPSRFSLSAIDGEIPPRCAPRRPFPRLPRRTRSGAGTGARAARPRRGTARRSARAPARRAARDAAPRRRAARTCARKRSSPSSRTQEPGTRASIGTRGRGAQFVVWLVGWLVPPRASGRRRSRALGAGSHRASGGRRARRAGRNERITRCSARRSIDAPRSRTLGGQDAAFSRTLGGRDGEGRTAARVCAVALTGAHSLLDERAEAFDRAAVRVEDELRERAELRRAVPAVRAVHERRVAARDALRGERARAQHRAHVLQPARARRLDR